MAKNGKFYFKWSVIATFGVLTFVFFAFFAKQFGETALELQHGDKKVSLRTSQLKAPAEKIAKFDPQRYHVDSMRGFSFELPSKKSWSPPELIKGFDDMLEAKGVTLAPGLRENIAMALAVHPMGPMLKELEMLRVVSRDSVQIEITDETSFELLDAIIESVREKAKEEGEELSKEDLSTIRHAAIGFERMRFSNEFTISIYDKNKLKGMPIKLSLASFFVALSSAMGLTVDHLVADEQSIFAGVSLSLERVKIDDRIKDFRVDRWMLLTENQEAFYLVEIAYSPQAARSIKVWEELQALLVLRPPNKVC